MISVLGLWGWFRGSLYAQIVAGVMAFLAAWTVNDMMVARKTIKKVEAKAKTDGKARNAKSSEIRNRIKPGDAWSRLQREYANSR